MPNRPSIITLLTDFGTHDYFVGAMKGVILSKNPEAQLVDITHDIPPQDIHAGAFNLLAAYRDFPPGTIHVGIVDPGVGSPRSAMIVECAEQFFVGPDNGLFSWICQREGSFCARQITNQKFFRQPLSNTFHGRDIFAPVAAALSKGVRPNEFGPVIEAPVPLDSLKPTITNDGRIEGSIIHIDRFGNCITNLTVEHLGGASAGANLKMLVKDRFVTSVRQFFSEKPDAESDLFMLLGSAGFVEIAARNASAASILSARRGQSVVLQTGATQPQITSA